jgi:hypothetical protein
MAIRLLKLEPGALLLILESAKGEPALPQDARITDVALDHGHTATHRDRPPIIVLQIQSSEWEPEPEGADRPSLPPMYFKR